ncbi:MAG: hypothetical protein ACRYGL_07355 [Janthinobacterium lividum]
MPLPPAPGGAVNPPRRRRPADGGQPARVRPHAGLCLDARGAGQHRIAVVTDAVDLAAYVTDGRKQAPQVGEIRAAPGQPVRTLRRRRAAPGERGVPGVVVVPSEQIDRSCRFAHTAARAPRSPPARHGAAAAARTPLHLVTRCEAVNPVARRFAQAVTDFAAT